MKTLKEELRSKSQHVDQLEIELIVERQQTSYEQARLQRELVSTTAEAKAWEKRVEDLARQHIDDIDYHERQIENLQQEKLDLTEKVEELKHDISSQDTAAKISSKSVIVLDTRSPSQKSMRQIRRSKSKSGQECEMSRQRNLRRCRKPMLIWPRTPRSGDRLRRTFAVASQLP